MVRPPDPFDFSDYSRPRSENGGVPDQGHADFTRSSGSFGAPSSGQQQRVFGQPPGASPAASGSVGRSAPAQMRTAPATWLTAGGAAAVIGLTVAVVAMIALDSGPVAVLAWILGGPVAIGLLAVFTHRDTQARASAFYSEPTWISISTRVVLVTSCIAVILSAWNIADWIGRL